MAEFGSKEDREEAIHRLNGQTMEGSTISISKVSGQLYAVIVCFYWLGTPLAHQKFPLRHSLLGALRNHAAGQLSIGLLTF